MHSPEVSDKDNIEIITNNEPAPITPPHVTEVKLESPVVVKEDKS